MMSKIATLPNRQVFGYGAKHLRSSTPFEQTLDTCQPCTPWSTIFMREVYHYECF